MLSELIECATSCSASNMLGDEGFQQGRLPRVLGARQLDEDIALASLAPAVCSFCLHPLWSSHPRLGAAAAFGALGKPEIDLGAL